MDFDISSQREGEALTRAESYRTTLPSRRSKAPLKEVPSHLRARRKRFDPKAIVSSVPCAKIPDWLREQLKR